jgi:hypothetical protein
VTGLEVRLFRPGDESAINDGFNHVFAKSRSLEEWVWKYEPSTVPVPIVAAWDGDRLAAHNGGIRSVFQIDGRRVSSLQGVDTLSLAAAERRPEWREAWFEVMEKFAAVAVDLGVGLLYGFTGGRAVSHMVTRARWDSIEPRRIPLFVRQRRCSGRSPASWFFRARPIGDHEPALDRLWEKVSHRYPVSIIRDADHARRRFGSHPTVVYHRWLIMPRWSSKPAAMVVFRTDGGVCRWVELVWDGRPGSLEMIDHMSRKLADQTGAEREELWLDGDPEAEQQLRSFGFQGGPDPSGVVRVIRFLDPSLRPKSFAPGRVYTTMADADLL